MNFQVILVCLVAETIFLTNVAGGSGTTAKLRNLVCISIDPVFMEFEYCRLKAINRTLTTFNVRATFLQSLRGFNNHFKVWKNSNGYKPYIIDVTVDGCAFLSGQSLPIFTSFHKVFTQYTNLNTSCPLPKTVIIEDLPISADMLPMVWPPGEYRIDVTQIFSSKARSIVKLYLFVNEK